MKRLLLFLVLFVLMTALASAEPALVKTPGGKLNARKTPSSKGKLAMTIPNGASVEAIATEGEWTQISYKGQEGYVKTDFLLLPSAMAGKTLYPDQSAVLIHKEADALSAVTGLLGPYDAVEINEVNGSWVKLTVPDGSSGYALTDAFLDQKEEPHAAAQWFSLQARVTENTPMTAAAEADSETITEVSKGTLVRTMLRNGEYCLCEADGIWGWMPADRLWLTGLPETGAVEADQLFSRDKAADKASAAVKKANKGFAKSKLQQQCVLTDSIDGIPGTLYLFGWFNDDGRFLYAAAVSVVDGKVLTTASFECFSPNDMEKEKLPHGEIRLTISDTETVVGGVIDIAVEAWTEESCAYSLEKDGNSFFDGNPGPHFTSAWKPREKGQYTLTVTVTDEEGFTASESADITVTGGTSEAPRSAFGLILYSQKDGSWADKAYRKSDLAQSGCAVFTLAHALQLLEINDNGTEPEALAKTFALCLTPQGTNNHRLLNEAGQKFGFKTKGSLTENKKEIAAGLKKGWLYSFSVARGHIALISDLSENGSMVRVIDSAPTATFERIVNTSIYIEPSPGSFRAVRSLDEVPGARWYFETEHYGALEYWMDIEYAARRGVRPIIPNE